MSSSLKKNDLQKRKKAELIEMVASLRYDLDEAHKILNDASQTIQEEQERSSELQSRILVLEKLIEEERDNFAKKIAEHTKKVSTPFHEEDIIEKKKLLEIIENLSTALTHVV